MSDELFIKLSIYIYLSCVLKIDEDIKYKAKVFGEIYWEENDIILVIESRVGICLKTI